MDADLLVFIECNRDDIFRAIMSGAMDDAVEARAYDIEIARKDRAMVAAGAK